MNDKPIQVLLIEDDFDAALLLSDALALTQPGAFAVTHSRHFSDALAQLAQVRPDLIILDLSLPESDGLDIVRQASAAAPDIPIVVLTGRASESLAQEAVRAGAHDYLVKGQEDARSLRRALRHAVERKRAEMALRASEQRLRALIENSADVVALVTAEGVICYESPAITRVLGYTPQELIGQNALHFLHPDDQVRAAALLAQLLQQPTQSVSGEFRYHHKNGSWRWVEATGANLLADVSVQAIVVNYRDITERKRSEEVLAHERNLLRTLIDNLPDRIYVKDLECRFVLKNLADARSMGETSPDEVIGKSDADYYPPDLAARYYADDQTVIQSGQPLINREEPALGADGILRWILTTKVPWRDGAGRVMGLVGIGRDITERKRAEEKLRESEIRFRALIENSADAIALINAESRILFASPAYSLILGYTNKELVGRNAFELIHPDDAAYAAAALGQVVQTPGASVSAQLRECHRDGSWRWLEGTAKNLLADPSVQAIVTNFRDITARKQAEAEIRQLKEFNENIVQQMTEGIVVQDAAGDFTFVNPAAAALLGYPPEALVSQPWTRIVPLDQYPIVRAADERRARGESDQYELDLVRADGARLSVLVSAGPHFEEGRPAGALVVFTDITARKQAEAALLRRNSELNALNQIGQALSRLAPPAELIELIYLTVGEVLDNRNFYLALYKEATQSLSFALYTIDGERRAVATRPLGNGLTEYILRTRAPLLITHDVDAALRERGIMGLGRGAVCYLGVPLLAGEKVLGVIALQDYEREWTYTTHHRDLLTTIAAQAAIALENAHLLTQAQQRAEQLAALNALGHDLAETLDLEQIYQRFYRATRRLLPETATFFVALFDAEHNQITCAYGVQDNEPVNVADLPPWPLEAPGLGMQSDVIHTRQPMIANDFPARLKILSHVNVGDASSPATQSALYVPMLAKGGVLGVIQAQSYTSQRYSLADAELMSSVANTAAVAIQNARLFTETRHRLEQLQALRLIDTAIGASLDLRLTLNVVLEQVMSQLRVHAAAVLLLEPRSQTLTHMVSRGFRSRNIENAHIRLGQGQAGRAALERRTVYVPDLGTNGSGFTRAALLKEEDFVAYCATPLSAKGQTVGVLEVFHRAPLSNGPDWLSFFEILAGQAAIAIDNAQLFESLQRSNLDLIRAYDSTLEGWSRALDLRDKETEGHTQRVTEMTLRLAQAMGMNEAEMVHLHRGALLHDIGKMGIPDRILLKPGSLTDDEWVVMRQHPIYAYEMLLPIAHLRPALDIPYCHHEKWDGTGYPRQLKGEAIPLSARLFAVVDVWDALHSDRPYRPAWPKEKVREHIRSLSGTHFDPKVVEAFLNLHSYRE